MYTAWQGTCKALISVIIYVGYLKVLTGKLLGACVVSVTCQRDRIANHLGRRASEGCLGSGNDCIDLPWSRSLKWESPNCGRDIPRAGILDCVRGKATGGEHECACLHFSLLPTERYVQLLQTPVVLILPQWWTNWEPEQALSSSSSLCQSILS